MMMDVVKAFDDLMAAFYEHAKKTRSLDVAVRSLFVQRPRGKRFAGEDGDLFAEGFARRFWRKTEEVIGSREDIQRRSLVELIASLNELDEGDLERFFHRVGSHAKNPDLVLHVGLASLLSERTPRRIRERWADKFIAAVVRGDIGDDRIRPYLILVQDRVLPPSEAIDWEVVERALARRKDRRGITDASVDAFFMLLTFFYRVNNEFSDEITCMGEIDRFVAQNPRRLTRALSEALKNRFRAFSDHEPSMIPLPRWAALLKALKPDTTPSLLQLTAAVAAWVNDGQAPPRFLHLALLKLAPFHRKSVVNYCIQTPQRFIFLTQGLSAERFVQLWLDVHPKEGIAADKVRDDPRYAALLLLQGKGSAGEEVIRIALRALGENAALFANYLKQSPAYHQLARTVLRTYPDLMTIYEGRFAEIHKHIAELFPSQEERTAAYVLLCMKKVVDDPVALIEAIEQDFYPEMFNIDYPLLTYLVDAVATEFDAKAKGSIDESTYKRMTDALERIARRLPTKVPAVQLIRFLQNYNPQKDKAATFLLSKEESPKLGIIYASDRFPVFEVVPEINDIEGMTEEELKKLLGQGQWSWATFLASRWRKPFTTSLGSYFKVAQQWVAFAHRFGAGEYLLPILYHPHHGYGVLLSKENHRYLSVNTDFDVLFFTVLPPVLAMRVMRKHFPSHRLVFYEQNAFVDETEKKIKHILDRSNLSGATIAFIDVAVYDHQNEGYVFLGDVHALMQRLASRSPRPWELAL